MTVVVTNAGSLAIVTIDNPPVNATSQAVRTGLLKALEQTERDDTITAVLLTCAGRTFIAGGDIAEFDMPPAAPELPDVIAAIEAASKPWVAVLHGTAFGGGLEVALACHYRIAAPETKLGLPEVTLGLIPGAGGTVRLPRLVGAETALEMIAGGKPVSAQAALSIGLIDRIVQQASSDEAMAFAQEVVEVPLPVPLPQRSHPAIADPADWAARTQKIKVRARGQLAPLAAILAVENAIYMTASEAQKAERAAFLTLKSGPQSRALRHVFFAERQASHMPELRGIAAHTPEHVGVIGGGTMGAGIVAVCLLSGLRATLIERDAGSLDSGNLRVAAILDDSASRGLISDSDRAAMLDRFTGATDYAAIAQADLAVEAVFEDMITKQAVFAELDRVMRPDAVLASNTSYLDINLIAAQTRHPSRVIGLHFFSPAHVMKLLELIVTAKASPEALAAGLALGKRLRKITVPAGVCDGFIGNRIMSAYRRTCEYLIEDGAMPWDVDRAMRNFGFPMGLFEMQDLAGLDISWAMRRRQATTRNPAERYVRIADLLCESGRFGRKSGKGWYDYHAGKGVPDPDVEAIIRSESNRNGIERREISDDTIMRGILASMKATGAALLAEGIARRPGDIDVVMINGYGYPRHRGGPMFDGGIVQKS
jgi:3-hydroxyacyl-CoA dehydrogenase